MTLEVGSHSID